MEWSHTGLTEAGFEGFVPWGALQAADVPRDPGVYVVLHNPGVHAFLEQSVGGWFKGRDPSVALDVLETAWVEGTGVVYIGKAKSLRSRLSAYRRFGEGAAVGHWGGRYIWQLEGSQSLTVAWRRSGDETPREVERRLIVEFVAAHGKRPFANLRD